MKDLPVYHLKDYLEYGTRKQFWKEPAIGRLMEAIKSKEIDMKGAAAMIGVSYGTLYGHYREVFGYLNSSMVSYVFYFFIFLLRILNGNILA